MIWSPEKTSALIAALSGLGGAAIGGYLTARSHDKERVEARRERLRDAYCTWLAAAEELSKCDEQTLSTLETAEVLYDADPAKLNEVMRAQWKEHTDALAKETSTFYRLALTEPNQNRVARIDSIRQIAPFLVAAATTEGSKHDIFMKKWKQQSAGIADIVKEVNQQLRMDDV